MNIRIKWINDDSIDENNCPSKGTRARYSGNCPQGKEVDDEKLNKRIREVFKHTLESLKPEV